MQGCPHEKMHECPRYVASHEAGNRWACMDGEHPQPCAVRRGAERYDEECERALEKLMEI